jgi:hypothetical protein
MVDDSVQKRIESLSPKKSRYIIKMLTQEIARAFGVTQTADDFVPQLNELTKAAGLETRVVEGSNWASIELSSDASGAVARSLLIALSDQPGGDSLVDEAIGRYQDTSLDLGVLSIGVSAAFLFLVVASEIEIDLDWFKLKKKGLSSKQQAGVAKEVLPSLFGGLPHSE